MIVTFYSFLMSFIVGTMLILICDFLKKDRGFTYRFGPDVLLFIFVLCAARMLCPVEFPEHQYVIQISLSQYFGRLVPVCGVIVKILLGVMIAGMAVQLIRLFYKQYQFCCYLGECTRKVCTEADEILCEIDTKRKMRVFQCEEIAVPFVSGLLHPVIYLPDLQYSRDTLYYIILHEYTHWKNGDLWVKLFVNLGLSFLWWNPFAYLLLRNLDETLELKCDYHVTASLSEKERTKYLETLLFSLKNSKSNRINKRVIVSQELIKDSSGNFIKQRFEMITGSFPKVRKKGKSKGLFVLVSLVVWIASYAVIVQPVYEPPIEEIETSPRTHEITADNSYLIKNANGTYTIVAPCYGSQDIIEEEMAQIMISQGFELREE